MCVGVKKPFFPLLATLRYFFLKQMPVCMAFRLAHNYKKKSEVWPLNSHTTKKIQAMADKPNTNG
jgi:hypothetical protein